MAIDSSGQLVTTDSEKRIYSNGQITVDGMDYKKIGTTTYLHAYSSQNDTSVICTTPRYFDVASSSVTDG